MYTTIIHPLRKAYCLSVNEYCVLEYIRTASNKEKYDFYCVAPFQTIAEALDLSKRTVIRAFAKLEAVGLIVKRRKNKKDTAVRSTDEWNDWQSPGKADVLLGLKTSNIELTSAQIKNKIVPVADSAKLSPSQCQIVTLDGAKLSPNTNIDIDTNTLLTSSKSFYNLTNKQKVLWHEAIKLYENTTGREASKDIKRLKLLRVLGKV